MILHGPSAVDIDVEFDALVRRYDGLVQQFRMERLGRALERFGPLAVRHSTCGFCGDRLSIWLDDDSVLKMKLYWPRRCALSALTSARWHGRIGWVVGARTAGGAPVDLYGWYAKVAYADGAG